MWVWACVCWGEIRGYWMAHQKFGRLPWKDLFTPTIEMAEKGFKVPKSLASAFKDAEDTIKNEPSLKAAYVNQDTNEIYKKGEILKLPELAKTLRRIQTGGEAAFYENGDLLDDILSDLEYIGSIISRDDLHNYKALLKDPTVVTFDDGLKIFSPPPPASGVVLSFILNVLDGYDLTAKDLKDTESKVRTMHRIVETFKFAYAKRTDLADEDFENVADVSALELWLGKNIDEAVKDLRLHHQLLPDYISYEENFNKVQICNP
nr:hypothetical protein BaRGS_010466 [Batillaria attramentaria]